MNDDFNDVINKFSEILKEKNIDINNLSDSLNNSFTNEFIGNNDNYSSINKDVESNSQSSTNTENFNDLSLDIETILKIKDIISRINKNQNSQRNKLLFSLKPYLENDKQNKLDSYIKIANFLSVIEEMDIGISFLENKKGYDLILIITLILLIF